MIVLNADNKVFVGQRIDNKQDTWQMPQGGIGKNEFPDQAMLREIQEEIGTRNVEIIVKSSKWYRYNFPGNLAKKLWGGQYKGQQQIWYALRFRGKNSEININTYHPEFRTWKWVDKEDVPRLVLPFKRELYKAVFNDLWPFVLKSNRQD